MDKNANKGFTLLETMLAIAIFTIMSSAVFLVLTSGHNSWFSGSAYSEIEDDIRKSIQWMTRELQEARLSSITIDSEDNSVIDFEMPVSVSDEGTITWQGIRYYWNEDENQLIRQLTATGEEKVLANNIEVLSFEQPDLNDLGVVRVTVRAFTNDLKGREMRSNVTFDVTCRN
ncbi:MAG: prepilin-type N-terminal cleavage/methylation domain-containing protein [Candidatus Omnitrophota bacterium]